MRRAEVAAAMTNISATNAPVRASDRSTAAITTETTASCRVARPAAVSSCRAMPSRPRAAIAAPASANTTSTTASTGLTGTTEPPMHTSARRMSSDHARCRDEDLIQAAPLPSGWLLQLTGINH